MGVGAIASSYAPTGGPTWSPTDLGDALTGWFDASDTATITSAATLVSQWNDKSGNARHHVQATDANKPKTGTRTLNGLNVIDFDGDDLLTHTWTAVSQPFTIAAVVQLDATSATQVIFGRSGVTLNLSMAAGAWRYAAGTAKTAGTADTSAHALVGIYNNTASRLRADGAQIHDGTSDSPGANGITAVAHAIGARPDATQPVNGAIAELVFVTGNLNGTGDLTSLETYLSDKWGI